jgi:hypothetical protein
MMVVEHGRRFGQEVSGQFQEVSLIGNNETRLLQFTLNDFRFDRLYAFYKFTTFLSSKQRKAIATICSTEGTIRSMRLELDLYWLCKLLEVPEERAPLDPEHQVMETPEPLGCPHEAFPPLTDLVGFKPVDCVQVLLGGIWGEVL